MEVGLLELSFGNRGVFVSWCVFSIFVCLYPLIFINIFVKHRYLVFLQQENPLIILQLSCNCPAYCPAYCPAIVLQLLCDDCPIILQLSFNYPSTILQLSCNYPAIVLQLSRCQNKVTESYRKCYQKVAAFREVDRFHPRYQGLVKRSPRNNHLINTHNKGFIPVRRKGNRDDYKTKLYCPVYSRSLGFLLIHGGITF